MVKLLQLLMEKQILNKGFTLIESILTLFIISCLSMLNLNFNNQIIEKYKVKLALTHLTTTQYEAILNKKSYCSSKDVFLNFQPCFNSFGNVNLAHTLIINKVSSYKIVVNLGAGKHYYK